MNTLIPFQIFISLLLGAAIGFERESSWKGEQSSSGGGVRTFSLVCLLGALAGLFYKANFPLGFIFISASLLVLISSYYIKSTTITKDFGLTTEFSFITTFLIGTCLTLGLLPMDISVALTVVLMLILAVKSETKKLIAEVKSQEVQAFIGYAIIALVILPFLPNINYTIANVPILKAILEVFGTNAQRFINLEILNPQRLWFIVVLITGIDVLGYILSKFLGSKKSFLFASFIGGFISSTSTTQSLAQKSLKTTATNYLVGSALLANLASFIQIFLLVGPLNTKWLFTITPSLIILIISSGILSWFLFNQSLKPQSDEENIDNSNRKIFSLLPALKFAILIVMVKFATGICLIMFGQSGFLISSIIASFAGLDAILVNLATLAGNTISFQFALLVFLVVNATNLLSKAFYSYLQGSKNFAIKFLTSALIITSLTFFGFWMF